MAPGGFSIYPASISHKYTAAEYYAKTSRPPLSEMWRAG